MDEFKKTLEICIQDYFKTMESLTFLEFQNKFHYATATIKVHCK